MFRESVEEEKMSLFTYYCGCQLGITKIAISLLVIFGVLMGLYQLIKRITNYKPITKENKKDIIRFKKKYLKNKKNLEYFLNQLSLTDIERITRTAFKRLDFNWDKELSDDNLEEHVNSIFDSIDKIDNKEKE